MNESQKRLFNKAKEFNEKAIEKEGLIDDDTGLAIIYCKKNINYIKHERLNNVTMHSLLSEFNNHIEHNFKHADVSKLRFIALRNGIYRGVILFYLVHILYLLIAILIADISYKQYLLNVYKGEDICIIAFLSYCVAFVTYLFVISYTMEMRTKFNYKANKNEK